MVVEIEFETLPKERVTLFKILKRPRATQAFAFRFSVQVGRVRKSPPSTVTSSLVIIMNRQRCWMLSSSEPPFLLKARSDQTALKPRLTPAPSGWICSH